MGKLYVPKGLKPYRHPKKVPAKIKTYVKRAIDKTVEDKANIVDVQASFGALTNAWTELSLCNPAEGTNKYGRSGTKIKVKSVEFKGVVGQGSNGLATDDIYNVVRIVLGKYSGQLTTPLQTAGITMNQPIKPDWNNARGLLMNKYVDKYITLTPVSTERAGGDGYVPQLKQVKFYKKFKNFYIRYSSDATTYPDKQLILSMLSDSIAPTNPGFVAGYCVVRFEDA